MAQRQVTGTVIESETEDAVASTTVKLLKMDSTYVAGCLTDLDGNFRAKAPAAGNLCGFQDLYQVYHGR